MNDLLFFTRYLNRFIIATAIAFAVLSMAACTTHRSVADQSVCATMVHDTVRLTQYRVSRDSIYLHDSVYLEVRGDTIRYTLYRDRWHTSYDTLHDTIYIAKQTDSTATTKHTEQSVTEKASSPLSLLRDWCIGIVCALLIFGAIWFYRHRYTIG